MPRGFADANCGISAHGGYPDDRSGSFKNDSAFDPKLHFSFRPQPGLLKHWSQTQTIPETSSLSKPEKKLWRAKCVVKLLLQLAHSSRSARMIFSEQAALAALCDSSSVANNI
jgi:hypothetical protein